MVHADMDLPIGGSSCVSCGTCLDVCPTGALIDKRSAFMGREEQTEVVNSICSQCSVGCGIDVVTRGGNVLRIEGDWGARVNGGVLCDKGRFEPLFDRRARVLTPLVRTKGVQEEVPWDRALQAAADRISETHPDGLGVIASTHATNEALYLVAKLFGKELHTTHIGLLNASTPVLVSGSGGSLADLSRGIASSWSVRDPAKEQPVAAFLVKRAVDRGAPLILIDGEETGLAAFATWTEFIEDRTGP